MPVLVIYSKDVELWPAFFLIAVEISALLKKNLPASNYVKALEVPDVFDCGCEDEGGVNAGYDACSCFVDAWCTKAVSEFDGEFLDEAVG